LRSVLKGRGIAGSEDLKHLPYLKNSLRETQRMTPTALGTSRVLPRPVTVKIGNQDNGKEFTVPANVTIFLLANMIGANPAYYERPDEFEPERWEEHRVKERQEKGNFVADHRFTNITFGFGPRMCLGARIAQTEMYSFMASILQDVEVRKADPNQKVSSVQAMMLIPTPIPKLQFVPL